MTELSTAPTTFRTSNTMAPRLTTLDAVATGERGRVLEVSDNGDDRRRLLEMGFCPGTEVQVLRRAPFGDPIAVQLRGYQLSLRRSQAKMIEIACDEEAPTEDEAVELQPVISEPAEYLDECQHPRIALAGNPNCGKTALFNAITGLRQKVANYPGVTIDKKVGSAPLGDRKAEFIDLPGTYSLTPASPDERVAIEVLCNLRPDTPRPDAVCVVVDASNLERNLLLLSQLMEIGLPLVVALNMMDVAESRGIAPDAQALEQALGIPVVPVVATSGRGLVRLRRTLLQARVPTTRPWRFHPVLEEAIEDLQSTLTGILSDAGHHEEVRRSLALNLLVGGELRRHARFRHDERLELSLNQARKRCAKAGLDPLTNDIETRYAWITAVTASCRTQAGPAAPPTISDRVDKLLLHPIAGLAVFGLSMWLLFTIIYTLADPIMGLAEGAFEAPGAWIGSMLGDGLLAQLWNEGIVPGVGGVLVFVPQIALLFLCLGILEESGYLARGAFLLDKPLAKVGLNGKSFIPMLSSHACAIPGVMSARSIEHPRDRLLTMLVAPFAACSARLPVYALLIGAFFAAHSSWVRGSILFGLYVLGIVAAAIVARALRSTILRGEGGAFMIELGPYRLPRLRQSLQAAWEGAWHFIRKAGTVILAFTVILWAGLTFPRLDQSEVSRIAQDHGVSLAQLDAESAAAEAARNAIDAAQISGSAAGQLGKAIEPVIAPMGADWQIGIGLLGAFAAREVFVSTMGVVYGVGGEVDEESTALTKQMLAVERADGSPLWTPALAIVIMVWFALAMQCISTTAVMRRETKSWRWPLAQVAGMNVLAWLVAVGLWQLIG
ncbi:MAG: ferrous iron transport protein B [Planctomycetota bacterium]